MQWDSGEAFLAVRNGCWVSTPDAFGLKPAYLKDFSHTHDQIRVLTSLTSRAVTRVIDP